MGALATLGKAALKMKIMSFKDENWSSFQGLVPLTINPENYVVDYAISSSPDQGLGTSGKPVKFRATPPANLKVDFLFDSSGLIDDLPRPTITAEIELLKKFLVGYVGSNHEPPYVMLIWGSFIFKGQCTSLSISYKMFSPEGLPTRAVCSASFSGFMPDLLRVLQEKASSPDLTHYRVVKDGDNLPMMCYNIYGDSKYYIQVAKTNKLADFRNLKTGMELFFPPILKTTD